MKALLEAALLAARRAGEIVMDVYRSGDLDVHHKLDRSLLTRADLESDRAIAEILRNTGVPIHSEEAQAPWAERQRWQRVWIVDPLDATSEFVSRNGEFSINIGLVEDGVPVLGVVAAPALSELYWASVGQGAYRERSGTVERLKGARSHEPVLIRSRQNGVAAAERFAARHGIAQMLVASSAVKFGRLADGAATVYPRYEESKEWDVAAGHAILAEVGGEVLELTSGEPLRYNKPDIRNPHFIAGAPGVDLRAYLRAESEQPR